MREITIPTKEIGYTLNPNVPKRKLLIKLFGTMQTINNSKKETKQINGLFLGREILGFFSFTGLIFFGFSTFSTRSSCLFGLFCFGLNEDLYIAINFSLSRLYNKFQKTQTIFNSKTL
ncbi:MAG: hypothetical protein IKA36_00235 [Clostridia bacterium]|nr:hypothetical protein [Clostridia bacterium]